MDFTPAQADAVANAVRLAAGHGDHVTRDRFKAGLAGLRAEIAGVRGDLRAELAAVETRLVRWVAGAALAALAAGIGAVAAPPRFRLPD